jgi:hypothetical protein
MKRKFEFNQPKAREVSIRDSRFGLRKIVLNEKESPSIATYRTPGRGVKGEHQN